MSLTRYKLWAVGSPVGVGVTGSYHVGIAGIAKKATAAMPYVVANEVLCNRLAQMLLLPCPPGALMEHGGETYFFSLDFNVAGHSLPPASAGSIVAQDPYLTWLIIAFDTLLMNTDRHPGNISHDRQSQKIHIFDHSHAFAGPGGNVAVSISAKAQQLAIGNHCLAQAVVNTAGFPEACHRIKAIPNFFIEGVVDQACQLGIPADDRSLCVTTLKQRRDTIDHLIRAHRTSFPRISLGVL